MSNSVATGAPCTDSETVNSAATGSTGFCHFVMFSRICCPSRIAYYCHMYMALFPLATSSNHIILVLINLCASLSLLFASGIAHTIFSRFYGPCVYIYNLLLSPHSCDGLPISRPQSPLLSPTAPLPCCSLVLCILLS